MSSMADLGAALSGGGGPPPGPGDLAGALGGGGGPPPIDLGAPPPDQGGQDVAQGDQGQQYGSSLEALQAAEDALHAFIQLDQDEPDRAVAAQCLQSVIKLKASNQTDQASGGGKSLGRALQAGGY